MAYHHTHTITDALGDGKEGTAWSLPSPTAHAQRRSLNPLLPSSLIPPSSFSATPTTTTLPPAAVQTDTILNISDGTSLHLTTVPASTLTTSGSAATLPATVAVQEEEEGSRGPYSADGCADDKHCRYTRTNTASSNGVGVGVGGAGLGATAMRTATSTSAGLVKGYDALTPPSAIRFFRESAGYFSIG
ncbi:MAG: hypothetical protein Q9188_002854, partial [Gyalolechia gomerana]